MDALASLAAMAIDRHHSIDNEDKAETAKKGEELRSAVMDALAHEFKTPLTAVQTASSGLLELGGLTDAQAEMVRLIEGEADRLNRLCTDLLKAAKVAPVQADMNIGLVDLRALVGEVLVGSPFEDERNRVVMALEDTATTARVNRDLLKMILKQYIENAHKYSTPGTPVQIAAHRSQGEILISVHSFGPTIRIEDRERIFERFYRSANVKDVVPGTGIGLSVAKKAADAHHGHVWVVSDEREGTTFFVSLPNGTRSSQ
jgi:two-component system sensor histidine kinase KdpD